MKPLKRIRYDTMNSWNLSQAPAYNLKVYNVGKLDLMVEVEVTLFYIVVEKELPTIQKKILIIMAWHISGMELAGKLMRKLKN